MFRLASEGRGATRRSCVPCFRAAAVTIRADSQGRGARCASRHWASRSVHDVPFGWSSARFSAPRSGPRTESQNTRAPHRHSSPRAPRCICEELQHHRFRNSACRCNVVLPPASEAMRCAERARAAEKSRRWVVVLGAWPAAPNHVGPQISRLRSGWQSRSHSRCPMSTGTPGPTSPATGSMRLQAPPATRRA